MTRRRGQRAILSPTGNAGEDQSRIDRRTVVGSDAEALASAGPETVQQHIGLGGQLQHRLRLRFDVQVDDPLPTVQQVAVFGRHRQATRAAHPHHVSTQVGEHHPDVRPRSDTTEFDDLHPGQGPPGRHRDY